MTGPALLMVGHGTKDPAGVTSFHDLLALVRQRLAARDLVAAGGFIELSAPPVTDAVSDLVAQGHRDVVAVPLVLVAAGHGKGDIPAALNRETARFPGFGYRYGRPLGPHPTLLTLLESRIDEAMRTAGWDSRGDVGVVLVGRGSTDPDANSEVAKIARLLWEGRGYRFVEPSFVSLAWPSVPEALDRADALGAPKIVVAQYFLLPGVLPDRVVDQARHWAGSHARRSVVTTGVLGATDLLADLVVARYDEGVRGDIRMNCDTCVYRISMPGFEQKVAAPQRPHDHPDDPAGFHRHTDGHDHNHGHDHGHDHKDEDRHEHVHA